MRKIRRGVGAAAGDPLPAERVVGEVGIDQRVPEPARALLPGDQQVLDQERRRRPCARGCASSRCARARACRRRRADSRCGRAARRAANRGAFATGTGELRPQRRWACGEMKQQVVGELAPAQLPEIRLGIGGAPDLGGADFAEVQMRREARGAGVSGTVAACGVVARACLRKRSSWRWAPGSPGCQTLRKPSAQSSLGSSSRAARGSDRGHTRGAGMRRGAFGAGGARFAFRHARQKGVNTRKGSPAR